MGTTTSLSQSVTSRPLSKKSRRNGFKPQTYKRDVGVSIGPNAKAFTPCSTSAVGSATKAGMAPGCRLGLRPRREISEATPRLATMDLETKRRHSIADNVLLAGKAIGAMGNILENLGYLLTQFGWTGVVLSGAGLGAGTVWEAEKVQKLLASLVSEEPHSRTS